VIPPSGEDGYHTYFKEQENGGQINGGEPLLVGSRDFPLGEIEQKYGDQSPSIVLFDGFQDHGARV
jgi:hypothetical protein